VLISWENLETSDLDWFCKINPYRRSLSGPEPAEGLGLLNKIRTFFKENPDADF